MKENLNFSKKEGTEGAYEQFDTDETQLQDKKSKKTNLLSPKQIIKYLLITFVVLCLLLLFFNLSQNKNISNILEKKSIPKKLELPLDQDELGNKPELKIVENKINLDYSIKGTDILMVIILLY